MLGKSRFILTLILPTALAACGGTLQLPQVTTTTGSTGGSSSAGSSSNKGSGSTGTTTQTSVVYSKDAGTAVQALSAGQTLTTESTASSKPVNIDFTNRTTSLGTPTTVTITKNNQGAITLTVNGVQQVFKSTDLEPNQYAFTVNDTTANKYVSVANWDGNTIVDEINGNQTFTKYAQPWEYVTNQLGNPSVEAHGFFITGTETKPADIGSIPNATYSGEANLHAYPASGYTGFQNTVSRVRSSVNMTADFGAGNVSGSLTNIAIAPVNTTPKVYTSRPGTISMDPAKITGNGFSGILTPDSTFKSAAGNPTITAGQYSGNFYGPVADEVAGTMSLSGSNTSGNFNANGFFTAKKN